MATKNKTFPTFIGLVVVGAIILGIVQITFLLRQQTLDPRETFVLYFKDSLEGLHEGSSITYRGVKIGEVTSFDMQISKKTGLIEIPIYVQFMRNAPRQTQTGHIIKRLVDEGYRARLTTTNLFTGESVIELIKRPKTVIARRHPDEEIYEIPTIETGAERTVLTQTMKVAEETLKAITKLVKSKEIKDVLTQGQKALKQLRLVLSNVNNELQPVMVNVSDAAGAVKNSASSFGTLSDYLARHPESLIKGKGS